MLYENFYYMVSTRHSAGKIWSSICIQDNLYSRYALVIARFRLQHDQYFPNFSYFADLFHEPLGEWNNSKIWETRKILAILCEINLRQLAYHYHKKYLLSVTVMQHLSREKITTINFFLQVIIKFYF